MNKAITTVIPNKWACQRAIGILDIWLDRVYCPLHQDPPDSDADECTCADEADVLMVRDYLRDISGEPK